MKQDRYSLQSFLARSSLGRALLTQSVKSRTRRRLRSLARLDIAQAQADLLLDLVHKATPTQFGRDHQFDQVRSLTAFQEQVPLRTYLEFWEQYWKRSYPEVAGNTWPTEACRWAVCDEGAPGDPKRLPVSTNLLESYRKGGETLLASYLRARRGSRLLDGRLLMVPGEAVEFSTKDAGAHRGSASELVDSVLGPWLRPFLLSPSKEEAALDPESRLERAVEASLRQPISMIISEPGQIRPFFERVLKRSGRSTIAQVWPRLELVIRAGHDLRAHSRNLGSLVGSRSIQFLESYSGPEGLLGYTSSGTDLLRLHFDHGIFYEFIPVDELGSAHPTRHWVGNLKSDTDYAIAISTCSGLWGYLLAETIRFQSITPLLFTFTGQRLLRRKSSDVVLEGNEAASAVADAAKATSSVVNGWRVGFRPGEKQGHYEFVIEFLVPPRDLTLFRRILDEELSRQIEPYRKLRIQGGSLLAPSVAVASAGGLDLWSRSHSPAEGPEVDSTGKVTSALIDYLRGQGQLLATVEEEALSRR